MEWVSDIINALGGGPGAVGLVAMGVAIWRLWNRNDTLTDRIIDMGAKQTEAMNALSREIEKATER